MSAPSTVPNAILAMQWAGLPSVAEDLARGIDPAIVAMRLRACGEETAAIAVEGAISDTKPHILGRPVVSAVAVPGEPISVFRSGTLAHQYAQAHGVEPETITRGMIADRALAHALIAQARP